MEPRHVVLVKSLLMKPKFVLNPYLGDLNLQKCSGYINHLRFQRTKPWYLAELSHNPHEMGGLISHFSCLKGKIQSLNGQLSISCCIYTFYRNFGP